MTFNAAGYALIAMLLLGLLYAGAEALIEASGYTSGPGTYIGESIDHGTSRWH